MDKTKKKNIKKIIALVCAVLLIAFLAVMPLLTSANEASNGPTASILSETAEYGFIETAIIGGGSLTEEEAVSITVPSGVKLTEYLVSDGDAVAEGDPIAAVDRVTVMTTIASVQETLEYLAEEIENAGSAEADEKISAQAGGTVKVLYAQEGDRVQDIMLQYGSLGVLNLDDLMAVDVNAQTSLTVGDTVVVTLPDRTETEGRVESCMNGTAVITFEDDDYIEGETVQAALEDGTSIGSGTMYLHSPWNITAYTGTVSDVKVDLNESVSADKTLFTLENSGYTAEYQLLSDQHREYEALMLELFQLYQSLTITAPCDGIVSGIDDDADFLLTDSSTDWMLMPLANAPNGMDTVTYSNYIGIVSSIESDTLYLKLNPQVLEITDYKDLSGVPTDPAEMTVETVFTQQTPVYELIEDTWKQIDFDSIAAGDTLLFAGDETGSFIWIVRISETSESSEPSESTEPSQPSEPSEPIGTSEPTGSELPSSNSKPTAPSQPGTGSQQSGNFFAGFAGSYSQNAVTEETFELHSLEENQIAAVTAQNSMTVTITVDELDVTELSVGQPANIIVNALSGESFTGTVTQISTEGTNEGGNSKYAAEITLDRAINMLDGMNASVRLTEKTAENVLTIPTAALYDRDSKTFVYTSFDEENGTLGDPVEVTVGISDGETVEILSGIENGTEIYYEYYDTLEIETRPQTGRFPFMR